MPVEAKKLDEKRETIFDAFFRKTLPGQIKEAAEFVIRSIRVLIYSREHHPAPASRDPSEKDGIAPEVDKTS